MVRQVKLPKGVTVTKQEFLEAVRSGMHDAVRERDRLPTVTALLPCFDCRHGAKALEEIAGAYTAFVHGERLPKEPDDRPLPYLPRTCCRQAKPAVADQVNDPQPAADAMTARTAA